MKRCFFSCIPHVYTFFYEKYIRMISGGSVGVGGLLIIVHPSGQTATASLHDTRSPFIFLSSEGKATPVCRGIVMVLLLIAPSSSIIFVFKEYCYDLPRK